MTILLALLQLAGLYLVVGAIFAALMKWDVQPDCPFSILLRFVVMAVIFGPYACARYRLTPWGITNKIWSEPK